MLPFYCHCHIDPGRRATFIKDYTSRQRVSDALQGDRTRLHVYARLSNTRQKVLPAR